MQKKYKYDQILFVSCENFKNKIYKLLIIGYNYKKAYNLSGELTMPDIISVTNIIDSIPSQYQYLLEIDDHFN